MLCLITPLQQSIQTVFEFDSAVEHSGFVHSGECNRCKISEGRCILHPSQIHFQLIEAIIILIGRKFNHLVVGVHGLQPGFALTVATTCSAHHLGEHVEGSLRGTEAVGIESQVRIQHTNGSHIREIQSLCHHLGADEHRDIFVFKMVQDLFMGIHRTDGIRIHAVYFHAREQGCQFLLDFLGADAQLLHGAAALATGGRRF